MKKILYVATIDAHINAFHLPYLKMLHDEGYEVHVATNGDEKFDNCDVKHKICIDRSPFKFNNIKAIKQLKKIIDDENFDIIHCHTPMGSVVARLAAKKARKKHKTKVVYTAHGFHFYKGAPLINWILFYPIEKWLAKYTDVIITINHEDENLAKNKFKKRCKNIKYIPGVGIDIQKYSKKITNVERKMKRKQLGFDVNDFLIIYTARLDKNKNQGLLINSIDYIVNKKKINNIYLLLVGPDECNGFYHGIVKKLGLEKYVHFLGYRNDVNQILPLCNLAVSSSIREGFGINLIEALCSNLPIVAVKNRGHNDIIINGENGFLVERDCYEMADKIISIYKDKSCKDVSTYAYKYSIDFSKKIVSDIYNEVLK